ncbi:MAG: hypothetical protein ACOCUH_02190, partial [Bacteriovoracia bacterium]
MQGSEALEKVTQIIKDSFSQYMLIQGEKVSKTSHIVDPWERGKLESYLIVSAVISGVETHQTRFKYVRTTDQLSSKCDCSLWTSESHCPHVVALLLGYQSNLKKQIITDHHVQGEFATQPMGHIMQDTGAAYVDEYGTVIDSISRLNGTMPKSTYSALQYKMRNGKIIRFPIVERWKGVLRINLHKAQLSVEQKEQAQLDVNKDYYYPRFSLVLSGNEICEHVTLFQYLYLFDWDQGNCFELPNDMKDFIRKLLSSESLLTINDYWRYYKSFLNDPIAELYIEGAALKDYEKQLVYSRITMSKGYRRGHMQLRLEFFNKQKQLLPLSEYFKLMVFDGGYLKTFKKKGEAYNFLSKLNDFFQADDMYYKIALRTSNERTKIEEMVDFIAANETLPWIDTENNVFYEFESFYLKKIHHAFLDCFGEMFYRFSAYDPIDKTVFFEMSQNALLENIYTFYEQVKILGINLYYNQNQVKSWSSQIRFDRQANRTDWFDLELSISKEDLEIIKSAEVDSNVVLSDQGLILLDEEQRRLMKLMKRYTSHDSEKSYMEEKDVMRFSLPLKRARIFELFELKKLGIEGALTEEELVLCDKLLTMDEMPEYHL